MDNISDSVKAVNRVGEEDFVSLTCDQTLRDEMTEVNKMMHNAD